MRRRDGEHPIHFTQRAGLVAAADGPVTRSADGKVGATRRQGIPATTEYFRGKAQAGAGGLRVEIAREVEHDGRRDQAVAGDAQFRLPAGGHAFDAGFKLASGLQQVASFVQQFVSRRGELGAMAAAVEQQHGEVFLEFLHGVSDRRRYAMQFMRGSGEAAFAVDGIDYQQGVEGKSHVRSGSDAV